MKILYFSLSLICFQFWILQAQMRINGESAFKAGEELKYSVRYGIFNAAYAHIKVDESADFEGNEVYQLTANGGTSGILDVMYSIRDQYFSYIDKKTFLPYFYKENIREKSYTRSDDATFFQSQKEVKSKNGTIKSPSLQTFDLVSAFYFARNLDLNNIHPNEMFKFYYFLEGEIHSLNIVYVGKEVIKTKLGKISCMKFAPEVKPGRIFRRNSKMYLWVTDDQNRIPVAANVEILVGSVKLELKSATGLKYPLNILKK